MRNKKNYRIDVNTTALLIRTVLDNFFNQKSTFCDKYLITTVIFGSNLNAMAPKISVRKLERRRSICINTVVISRQSGPIVQGNSRNNGRPDVVH